MEETRGITVKVRESLHGKAKQETEETGQTMSQFIEKVLEHYFNRSEEKEMSNTKADAGVPSGRGFLRGSAGVHQGPRHEAQGLRHHRCYEAYAGRVRACCRNR